MAEFNKGDKVEFREDYFERKKGTTGTIVAISNYYGEQLAIVLSGGNQTSVYTYRLKLLSPGLQAEKETTMTQLTDIQEQLFDADTQALVRAGYLYPDLTLTSVGQGVLTGILLGQNKEALVAKANDKIAKEQPAE